MNSIQKKIYSTILNDISKGKRLPGDKLPPEVKLAEQFKTNRMNAHLAIKSLEESGIVKRNKRQGTIIEKNIAADDLNTLKLGTSNLVIVLASPPDRRNNIHWNESTLFEFELLLQQQDHTVHFAELPNDPDTFATTITKLSILPCCALVLIPDMGATQTILDNIKVLEQIKSDIIMLDRGNTSLAAFPYHTVGYSPYEQGITAGHYLMDKRSNYISAVASESEGTIVYWAQQRFNGLNDTVTSQATVSLHTFPGRSLAADTLSLLKKSKDKQCIVAMNDHLAIQIIDHCNKHNLIAGIDYDIISFDNYIDYRKYNLTTIANPMDKIAPTMAEIITKRILWKKDYMSARIFLKPILLKRQTA